MVIYGADARETHQVHIRECKSECEVPYTRRGRFETLHVEIKSTKKYGEETEFYPVDPLSSRGINKFLRESDPNISNYEIAESNETMKNNYKLMTTNNRTTEDFMMPNQSASVANQSEQLLNHPAIDANMSQGDQFLSKPVPHRSRSVAKSTRRCTTRDREPSRVAYKKVIKLLTKKGKARLAQHGLRALEVGADGSCFYRSVSYQLYNDPGYHMNIRTAAVNYMRLNPQRFIEHITEEEHSWVMTRQCQ